MNEIDKNIFELIGILQDLHLITLKRDFYENIGILKQNLSGIKTGRNHFTHKHILNICKHYNVNVNWIYGLEKNVFRAIKT
ncbi:hypothetical protein OX284_007750 [Flavobacterium sp. SUN046]|uniref:hypothetical protein n=1 Tax=Flavobacterium sp. SUN046 TaxID=3002440 RepID=UPI002DBA7699|nr:hypothetical protein [Flavobacterium sp. SUN046]MEC4049321.1 hypothetical protein [Flavobacterium sp. SUN046]